MCRWYSAVSRGRLYPLGYKINKHALRLADRWLGIYMFCPIDKPADNYWTFVDRINKAIIDEKRPKMKLADMELQKYFNHPKLTDIVELVNPDHIVQKLVVTHDHILPADPALIRDIIDSVKFAESCGDLYHLLNSAE